jgi:hypothetical protein
MQINHFLPFFFCSVILLILCPSSKSPLHHIVLSFCSSSACSIVLLCFCLLYRSALLLLLYRSALSFCSASTLLYHSVLHFISFCTSSQMSHHTSLSYCFILFPFRTATHTVCFISFYTRGHNVSTSQLLGQTDDNCPANRNAKQSTTNLQS